MEWIIGIFVVFLIIGWIKNAIDGGNDRGGGGGGGRRSNVLRNSAVAGVAGYAIGKKIAKL